MAYRLVSALRGLAACTGAEAPANLRDLSAYQPPRSDTSPNCLRTQSYCFPTVSFDYLLRAKAAICRRSSDLLSRMASTQPASVWHR